MPLDESRFGEIEITGGAIFPVIRAIQAEALCRKLLERYDLLDPKKDAHYPVKQYLGLLREIAQRMPTVLKHVGKFICEEVVFPPNATFEQILMGTDLAYQAGHRGHKEGEIGHYRPEKISDREFRMTVDDPYPCLIDQGIIQGFALKYEQRILLDHVGTACRAQGDPACVYRIRVLK